MDITLDGLNETSAAEFAARLGGVFEHAPWIAERAATRRPFASLAALFEAMTAVVAEADEARRLDLLRGHPELAGAAARSGDMTDHSKAEQAGAGLAALTAERAARFDALNRRHRERFGFPFIVCVKRHGRDSILAEFERRAELSPQAEREQALAEVSRIAALRLDALVRGPDRLPVHGRLSTHVLDTASGRPAEGVSVELLELAADGAHPVATAVTNADGRTDAPLISDRPIPRGGYELRFGLGAYHRAQGHALPEPAFLDVVPIRFGVAEPEGRYHVPLVASPWAYSSYRGS